MLMIFQCLALCGCGKIWYSVTYSSGSNPQVLAEWFSGFNTINHSGNYGVQGTGSVSNIPGSRWAESSWVDTSGNFWLFGGPGYDSVHANGYLNDLWQYNPTNGQWTWVSGSNVAGQSGTYGVQGTGSTSNIPGGRGQYSTWVDSSGNFWFFGGLGYDSVGAFSKLNDLWEYTPSNGQWTWIEGSNTIHHPGLYGVQGSGNVANIPGSRNLSATWADTSGNFWLFGGFGYDKFDSAGTLNDLWKFTPSNSKWTWMEGSNAINQSGTYGTQGTGSVTNIPGARGGAASWTDSAGNFWLFGGDGFDSVGTNNLLNDLWEFTPSNGQWTWVSGSPLAIQSGIYGTLGVANSANIPGSRQWAASWVDTSGHLWLFGGLGLDSAGNSGGLNDLWEYFPNNNQWVWIGGSNIINSSGTYGTQGVGSPGDIPGVRQTPATWLDSAGRLWFFGGQGLDASGAYGVLSDLWIFANP